jgi:ParB family chromosome partitioning protein
MKKVGGLGRGIETIFIDNSDDNAGKVTILRIGQIEPRGGQPRKFFDAASLESLSESIKLHGVLQPIIVREIGDEHYQIIAGERRFRAAKMANLKEIPVVVVDGDDQQTDEIALIENIQRENLNPVEEAQAYKSLIEDYNLTQEQLSEKLGKSRSAIANSMRLLLLPEKVRDVLAKGEISAGHARALLSLTDEALINLLVDRIIVEDLSVRAIEDEVRAIINRKEKPKKEEEQFDCDDFVDYIKDLENRSTTALGRRIKINSSGKNKYLQISYGQDEELEEILKKLCGEQFFE